MRKNWLRGVLLGVSVTLLLASGVALARGKVALDQECFECVPIEYWDTSDDVLDDLDTPEVIPEELDNSDGIPEDPYELLITGRGWDPGQKLSVFLLHPNWWVHWGPEVEELDTLPAQLGEPFTADDEGKFLHAFLVWCETPELEPPEPEPIALEDGNEEPPQDQRGIPEQFGSEHFGPMDVCAGDRQPVEWDREVHPLPEGHHCASVIIERSCEEEFVPEPGTIALLGSGLMGLAGYAGLRLRRR